jgi:hypothetical protein
MRSDSGLFDQQTRAIRRHDTAAARKHTWRQRPWMTLGNKLISGIGSPLPAMSAHAYRKQADPCPVVATAPIRRHNPATLASLQAERSTTDFTRG